MRKPLFRLLAAAVIFSILLTLPALALHSQSEGSTGHIVQLNTDLPQLLDLCEEESPIREISAARGLYAVDDPAFLKALQDEGMVEYAEPDYAVELFDTVPVTDSGDGTYDLWHLEMLKTARGDALGCFGQDIRVAVIDSGCAPHADLASALLPGWNYLKDTDDVTDNIGHGTFVSGLIAAEDNDIGVTGAAPEAKIIPLKCFDNGATTRVSTLTAALYAAVDEFDCRVINMSFGLKDYSQTLESAITYAADSGAVCVASAGNLGTSTLYYPAAFSNVIGVGAVDNSGLVASFSQRNTSLAVVAPGKAVCSTTADDGYAFKNGTSFSAPLIAALCARLLTADETLTPQKILHLLTASATDLGEEGYDTTYGHGLAQLDAAMDLLLADTEVFLSPFCVSGSDLQISLFNNSSEDLSGQCLFTRYRQDIMVNISWEDIHLAPGETLRLTVPLGEHTVKCTFWPNLGEISPITPYRECEVAS